MAHSSQPQKVNMPTIHNPFGSESKLSTKAGDVTFYDLGKLEELGLCKLDTLPFSIKVLLESRAAEYGQFRGFRAGRDPAGQVERQCAGAGGDAV